MEPGNMHHFEEDLAFRLAECRTRLQNTIAKIGDPLELETILDQEVRFRMEDLHRHFRAYLASLLSNAAEDSIEEMSAEAKCVFYGGQFEKQSIGEVDIPAWPGWRARTTRATRYLASAAAAFCVVGASVLVMASRLEPVKPATVDPVPESEFPYFGLSCLAFAAAASATLAVRPRLLPFLKRSDQSDASGRVAEYLEAVREIWMTAARSAEAHFREHLLRLSAEYPQDESQP